MELATERVWRDNDDDDEKSLSDRERKIILLSNAIFPSSHFFDPP